MRVFKVDECSKRGSQTTATLLKASRKGIEVYNINSRGNHILQFTNLNKPSPHPK